MRETIHANTRMQQRGIPKLVLQWLNAYGARTYDGNGGLIRYFDKNARRRLVRDIGRDPARRMRDYLDSYAVYDCQDEMLITVGTRYKRLRRR